MPSVLIRDVPDDELDVLRTAAAARGQSLQAYLLDAVHARTAYARRQIALEAIGGRLKGRPAVTESSRRAVLDAVDAAHDERANQRAHDR